MVQRSHASSPASRDGCVYVAVSDPGRILRITPEIGDVTTVSGYRVQIGGKGATIPALPDPVTVSLRVGTGLDTATTTVRARFLGR